MAFGLLHKQIITGGVIGAVLAILVSITTVIWVQETTRKFPDTFNTVDCVTNANKECITGFSLIPSADGFLSSFALTSFDSINARASFRVMIGPVGEYNDGNAVLSEPVTIMMCDITNQKTFAKGTAIPTFDVAGLFCNGDNTMYPMDVYNCTCTVIVYPGIGNNGTSLPVGIAQFLGGAPTFVITPNVSVVDGDDMVANVEHAVGTLMIVTLQRSTLTKIFAITGAVMMWALSLGLLTIAIDGGLRGRPVEATSVGWYIAMIFALPSFRNNLPGQIPLGAVIDVAAYYWAQLLVVIGCCVMMYRYLMQWNPPKQ